MPEKIKNVDYESEIGQNYVDYAMSVICGRAFPDVRDGLKPVQRRILHSLNDLTKSSSPHRKCARIVGDTMGKYHPHGDSSIYEGLVNMSQNWKSNIPLVDPHGNFGALDGSSEAAMRYTEARIAKYTEDVGMKDISFFEDQFVYNFDSTEKEPTVLPFQVPNILTNGSTGVAVGMATNIPSHNLGEVIDATIACLNNPDISLDELLEIIKGPDFATGGYINASKDVIYNAYKTGIGKIKVRGKVVVKDIGYGKKSICIEEIPFTMIGHTDVFLNKVAELYRNREIPAVTNISDRGDRNGVCLCIDVKKGTSDEEIQNIINILYKKTGLEDTYGINMNCIVDGLPKVLGLKEILSKYIEFKYEVYTTKYNKLLEQQYSLQEVKKGLLMAVDCIDLIIEILRASKKVADAKDCLINGNTKNIKFRHKASEKAAQTLCFTENQANAILGMRLQKLIGLEIKALKKELSDVEELIKEYSNYLNDNIAMKNLMTADMLKIKDSYGFIRKTQIADFGEVQVEKSEEVSMDVAVLLDRFYYLKVVDASTYEKNLEAIKKEYRYSFACSNLDRIGIFADNGYMYMIKVNDVIKYQTKKSSIKKKSSNSMIGKLSDKGVQIFDFCKMKGDENILYMDCIESFINSKLLFLSSSGKAKLVEGSEFDVSRKNISSSKADENIVFVSKVEDNEFLITKSQGGIFSRLPISELSIKSKGAGCSKGILCNKGDLIECASTGTTKDMFRFGDKEIPVSKIKLIKKGEKGSKLRI